MSALAPPLHRTCRSCSRAVARTPQIYPSLTPSLLLLLLHWLPLRWNLWPVGSWPHTARPHGRAPPSHWPVHPHRWYRISPRWCPRCPPTVAFPQMRTTLLGTTEATQWRSDFDRRKLLPHINSTHTIENDPSVMDERCYEEDILPLLTGLKRIDNHRLKNSWKHISIVRNGTLMSPWKLSTLCLVMAPTMRGHTIPDNVPTPFEIPISMLA